MTISPVMVAELYHNRWQIELFFKWIKKMNIERSIYEILQIVSVSLTDATPLKVLFAKPNYIIVNELDCSTGPTLF